MKKYIFVFSLILLIVMANLSVSVMAKDKIILTSQDLPPLGSLDSKGNFDGLAVRVIRYALGKMNQNYDIIVLPWKRAQEDVKQGNADGFFPATRNPERSEFAVPSESLIIQQQVWYMLKENPLDPTSNDFIEKAGVGSFNGSNSLAWLIQNKYHVIAQTQDAKSLFKMLVSKRVDAILLTNLVANDIIASENLGDRIKSYVHEEADLCAYFSKKFIADNPGFLDKFNNFVREYNTKK